MEESISLARGRRRLGRQDLEPKSSKSRAKPSKQHFVKMSKQGKEARRRKELESDPHLWPLCK